MQSSNEPAGGKEKKRKENPRLLTPEKNKGGLKPINLSRKAREGSLTSSLFASKRKKGEGSSAEGMTCLYKNFTTKKNVGLILGGGKGRGERYWQSGEKVD